jgi:uncharacterized protein (TIGR00251 family)
MKEIRNSGKGRIRVRVRVQPAAGRNELLGWNTAGELRIRIAAPPREGEANKKLIAFLAKRLSVTKREIEIESGGKSKTKVVSLPDSVEEILRELRDV